jgi:hypothetical protein
MKTAYKLIAAAVLSAFALGSQCLYAADSSITLHVPFAFVVNGKTMPAGAYTIDTDGTVVAVRGSAGTAMVTSGPRNFDANAKPALIFSRQGGTTYLVGVRTEEDARTITASSLQAR